MNRLKASLFYLQDGLDEIEVSEAKFQRIKDLAALEALKKVVEAEMRESREILMKSRRDLSRDDLPVSLIGTIKIKDSKKLVKKKSIVLANPLATKKSLTDSQAQSEEVSTLVNRNMFFLSNDMLQEDIIPHASSKSSSSLCSPYQPHYSQHLLQWKRSKL